MKNEKKKLAVITKRIAISLDANEPVKIFNESLIQLKAIQNKTCHVSLPTSGGILVTSDMPAPSTMKWKTVPSLSVITKCSRTFVLI